MDAPAYFTVLQDHHVLDMESSIKDVEHYMARTNHTLAPVIDLSNKIFGVVSSIDVIQFLSGGGNPNSTKAWEICSHKLLKAPVNTAPVDLARMFLMNRTHHILLTDDTKVVAIVSSMDLCKYLLEKSGQLQYQ